MAVPSENGDTTEVKLLIPNGLQSVTPNAKPGWVINEQKTKSRDSRAVTEIDWTGGTIPQGQRDDFLFEAQVPSSTTTLKWKAYQTYNNGKVVAWVNPPGKNPEDDSAPPPYSQTVVVNDLTNTSSFRSSETKNQNSGSLSDLFSGFALLLSIGALYYSWANKRT